MRISPERTELARARMSAKMPQKELANRLDVGVRYLRAVELGEMKSTRLTERAMRFLKQ